jgi:hypothetical protein
MFRAGLKLTYFPGAPDLVLSEDSQLKERLHKPDGPVMILPSANGPAGF